MERFPPLLWLVGIQMQAFWGGAKLLQRCVVVFWILHTVSPVNFPEFFDLKTYSVHQLLLVHQRRKVETRKWNESCCSKPDQKMDLQSINQPYQNTFHSKLFYKHWLECSMDTNESKFELLHDENYIRRMNDEISHRAVPSLSFVIRIRLICVASVDWLIDWGLVFGQSFNFKNSSVRSILKKRKTTTNRCSSTLTPPPNGLKIETSKFEKKTKKEKILWIEDKKNGEDYKNGIFFTVGKENVEEENPIRNLKEWKTKWFENRFSKLEKWTEKRWKVFLKISNFSKKFQIFFKKFLNTLTCFVECVFLRNPYGFQPVVQYQGPTHPQGPLLYYGN